MPFGDALRGLIGYAQNQADQQAGAQGIAGGGQQAAIGATQLQHIADQNQQAFGRYNYIIRQDVFGNPEYIAQAPARPAPRPQEYARARDYMGALQDIAASWMNEGMEFSEILVPKATYIKLLERSHRMRRFEPGRPVRENEPPRMEVLTIATAMGMVRFVCEENKSKYNLDKYMETVD
jgi:hypothetical protein